MRIIIPNTYLKTASKSVGKHRRKLRKTHLRVRNCAVPHAQMKKSQFFLNTVFLASIVHLYSELQVNPFRNKDIGAEKLVCAFAHFRKRKWKKMKSIWFMSCDDTFWLLYWNQHHYLSFINGDTTEKLFGAIEPFSASANEKNENLSNQSFCKCPDASIFQIWSAFVH